MKIHMIADHIRTNLSHKSPRYQRMSRSRISFKGTIPMTVGKIAPIHHRNAEWISVLVADMGVNGFTVRNVTAATIAKLRKMRIWEAVLFSSPRRVARRLSSSFSRLSLESDGTKRFYIRRGCPSVAPQPLQVTVSCLLTDGSARVRSSRAGPAAANSLPRCSRTLYSF